MNTRTRAIAGLAAALLGGTTLATASTDTGAERRAAASARTAGKAIARHNADRAIAAAETAVGLAPRNASYRAILGEAYLTAGRFASAAQALNDALALDPSNGVAALHLALAQIANGDWAPARATLALHEATIGAADRGLALALAGDPASAVELLTVAARTPGADAKTRQNLALSLALAGRWNEAKTVAAADVAPGEVDARIMQWAAFAHPRAASDQVAALLGVTPVADGGQPVQLALNTTLPTMAALAQPVDPVDGFMPGPGPAAPAAVEAVAAVAAPAVVPGVTFGDRREVVQAVPAPAAPRARPAALVAIRSVRTVQSSTAPAARPVAAGGNYYVQLGAFENAGVARDSWRRLAGRHAALNAMSPQGTRITINRASFYRLSVGGFTRAGADRLCGRLRTRGGTCFVRSGAGDVAAAWSRPQVASR